ncbi:MAG: DUF6544 family protein [Haloarculaceae archaeon]
MSERRGTVLPALGALLAAAVGLVLFNTLRVARLHDRLAADLVAGAEADAGRAFAAEDVADLPDPVRRYFETAIEEGRPYVRSARLEQRGEFRLGDAERTWRPMEATQRFTVDPPGFVWSAVVRVLPFLPVRVLDAYDHGSGVLRARLLSTVTVVDVGPDREMNEGELLRYLAEAVWFPTALLPTEGVEWEAVDDRSARATIEHGGNTATATFHFDERDRVERVTAERYRQETDDHAPWTGHFRAYETRNGLSVPTEADVEWNLPEGDRPYWRARIARIEHWPA